MPAVSRDIIRDELRRGEIRPAYLLYGPEVYLRDTAANTVCKQTFGEGDFRDMNETTFRLSTDPDQLLQALAAAEQLPMMSSRRVVKITDIRISATGIRDTVTEDSEPALRRYLEDPSPTTTVVFIADELNGNRKMSKLLKELTAAVEFKQLEDKELIRWVSGEARSLNADLPAYIAQYLVARAGTDLHRLGNEIRKVSTAALPSGAITEDLIDQLVPTSRELDNFAFTNHLVAGRRGKAMAALKKILDDGTDPLALMGAIGYTFRRLVMAKDLMEHGADRREVANVLRLPYTGQEAFLAAARRARMADLSEGIRSIASADIAIKNSIGGSGPAGARMQLEMLVAKLALALPG